MIGMTGSHRDYWNQRYIDRPWPEEQWGERSRQHPLLQTRTDDQTDVPLLEVVLRDPRPEVHQHIAQSLWESTSDEDAVDRLRQHGRDMPPRDEPAAETRTSNG